MANDVFGIVGTTLAAAFHVEAVVAEGGFAVVYRAYHSGFRAKVALKCLKIPQHLSRAEQEKFEEQFQAEAELLFKLSATIPTVVRPLHVEAIIAPDGSFMPFIALEWLEGETLDALSQRRTRSGKPPFRLDQLVSMLTPVARALERAHRFVGPEGPISIVHRDMKPENVFVAQLGGESVVKILDFGIGKAKSVASQVAGRASQNDVGVTSFTPAYGAPEQWAPKRYGQTGPWTDVWGLALTMVEVMAARPIIDGDQAAMMGTVLDPARRPTPRAEGISVGDSVEAVFAKALALDPRHRYAHAGEFWDALMAADQADKNRQTKLSDPLPAPRASGRSGAYSFHTPAQSRPELGRHNLIPDLDVPVGSAAAIEVDVAAKPATRSGQRLVQPIETVDEAEAAARASSSPPAASLRGSRSGQFPSAAPVGVPAASRPPDPPPRVSARPDVPNASRPPPSGGAPSGAGPASAPRMQSPQPPKISARPVVPVPPSPSGELVRRFAAPALMVVVGVLLTLGDGAYAAANGEVFTLGPVRLAWLATGLVIAGIGLAVYRLLFDGAE